MPQQDLHYCRIIIVCGGSHNSLPSPYKNAIFKENLGKTIEKSVTYCKQFKYFIFFYMPLGSLVVVFGRHLQGS